MKIAVFWVVAPCSLVEVYQRFRGPCCLHHQGDRPKTQKTAIFILTAVRTSNPTPFFCLVVAQNFKMTVINLKQCCATFLHSRHTKYCRRVMAAHQPHCAYCGGGIVYGIDWQLQLLINRPQPENVLFDVHNYPSLLLRHLF
jgi:hypothetical protein